MEQFNDTPENHPAKDWIFGRVRKWIGPERPDPVPKTSFGTVITVLVDTDTPHTSSLSTRSVRLTDQYAKQTKINNRPNRTESSSGRSNVERAMSSCCLR